MRTVIVFAIAAACAGSKSGSSGDGSNAGSGSGGGGGSATFMLSGMLSDPLGNPTNQRAVVGIAHEPDVSGSVDCSKLVTKWDQVVAAFPATYTLGAVPQGTWFLVAVLPGGSGQAPFGLVEITVDHAGIHNNSQSTTSVVDVAIGGTTPYACP